MANIERSNIQYRLNSGRVNYIAKGGKLGRKTGSFKTEEKKKDEYKEVIALLKKEYSVRNIAKFQKIGVSTVQRIKNQFIKNAWPTIKIMNNEILVNLNAFCKFVAIPAME